ncbi:MAG: hypothetical protein V1659_04090 [Candidatus Woesearchaeota archaeon]
MITPRGELAEYFVIENQVIHLSAAETEKQISYRINLPPELSSGARQGGLVVVEVPESGVVIVGPNGTLSVLKDKTIISSALGIEHQLRVNVPYPKVHAEGELFSADTPGGGKLFTISVFNLGSEKFSAHSEIVILGPTNQEIERLKTGTVELQPSKEGKLVASWDPKDNAPGNYYAKAVVFYNEKYFTTGKIFRTGEMDMYIDKLSVNNFRLGGIAKLDALLSTSWNEPITGVYSVMQILKSGNVLSEFKTSTIDVPAQGTATASGYWDTNGVDVGDYDVNVLVNFAGKSTQKFFKAVVGIDSFIVQDSNIGGEVIASEEKGLNKLNFIILLVIVLVVINVLLVFYVKKKK